MRISLEKLTAEAEATGFRPDVLEKVAHLIGLLDAIRSHPFLKGKLVLKGGTALNLDLLMDEGVVDSSILTDDEALQQRIQSQPLLEWKALNVRRHKGLS